MSALLYVNILLIPYIITNALVMGIELNLTFRKIVFDEPYDYRGQELYLVNEIGKDGILTIFVAAGLLTTALYIGFLVYALIKQAGIQGKISRYNPGSVLSFTEDILPEIILLAGRLSKMNAALYIPFIIRAMLDFYTRDYSRLAEYALTLALNSFPFIVSVICMKYAGRWMSDNRKYDIDKLIKGMRAREKLRSRGIKI
jgi:hypothetical protein